MKANCKNCNVLFQVRHPKTFKLRGYGYCSIKCSALDTRKTNELIEVSCGLCHQKIYRSKREITINKMSFCSRKCSTTYYGPQNIKKQKAETPQCFCSNCNIEIFPTKRRLRLSKNLFCSVECSAHFRKKHRISLICTHCKAQFTRRKHEFLRNKNQSKVFCSNKCSSNYNCKYRRSIYRRSQLEVYIEQQLKSIYQFDILFNDRSTINSELDIYIPSLRLGIEINGIFHYKPIFGIDKLNDIQRTDK